MHYFLVAYSEVVTGETMLMENSPANNNSNLKWGCQNIANCKSKGLCWSYLKKSFEISIPSWLGGSVGWSAVQCT